MSSAAATPIDRATKLALVATGGAQTTLRISGVLALVGFFVALVFVGWGTPREQSMPRISEATTGGTT